MRFLNVVFIALIALALIAVGSVYVGNHQVLNQYVVLWENHKVKVSMVLIGAFLLVFVLLQRAVVRGRKRSS